MFNFLILSFCLLLGASTVARELESGEVRYFLDEVTGGVSGVDRSGRRLVSGAENHYFVRRFSGDAEGYERSDRPSGSSGGWTYYENSSLPGIRIGKSYLLEGKYLRRGVRFENTGRDTAFVTMRTRTRFSSEFYRGGFYLGAGYIGPLTPVPELSVPQKVTRYKQSTKGMLLYHDRGNAGSFAHYRVKTGGRFVFPWWQSAITNYVEPENCLYYHPDGWEMSFGTVDVPPGGSFELVDTFIAFSGAWFRFMNEIYPGDPLVKREMAQLQQGPAWLQEVCAYVNLRRLRDVRQLARSLNRGNIMVMTDYLGGWADYRLWHKELYPGQLGGGIRQEEMRGMLRKLQEISPRVKAGCYTFLHSGFHTSPIVKEHPEYFMLKDRSGRPKNLFPGQFVHNFPSMVNRKDARDYYLNEVIGKFIDEMKTDFYYLDETKTTNLIDWEKGDCVRDDHWYDFWKKMGQICMGKNAVTFGNGRGNPYQELNFIEAAAQLNPRYWRQFAGMALAVAALESHRPGGRICLLYWRDNVDYIDRVLANGFIPALFPYRERQIPFVRAVAENGPLRVKQLRYAPDWKSDPVTGLESYAVERCKGEEILLSMIRREKNAEPEVTIDLKDCPRNLSVWCYRIADYRARLADRYCIGDDELRQIYRANGWREGVVAEPELLYRGENPGKLQAAVSGLPVDRMAMLAIGHPLAGIYSEEGLPRNFFYSSTGKTRILNREMPLEIDCQAAEAEVILFRTGRQVTVNSRPAKIRYAEFGGQYFPVVPIARGRSVIADAGKVFVPENLIRVRRDGILRFCGSAFRLPEYHAGGMLTILRPGQQPEDRKTAPGRATAPMRIPRAELHPPVLEKQAAYAALDGAVISEGAAFLSRWRNETGLQPGIPPRRAGVDLRRLQLQAGTTRRVADYIGDAAAGFRITGAEKLDLQLDHTFDDNAGIFRGHVSRYHRKTGEFAGLMVDYRTADGWQRIAFSLGKILHSRPEPGAHPWGSGKIADRIYRGGEDWLKAPGRRHFTLSLRRYAPADWTGEAWVTAAVGFVNPGKMLMFTIQHANGGCRSPESVFRDNAEEIAWLKAPRKLSVPGIAGRADFAGVWKNGTGAKDFARIRHDGRAGRDSEFRIAHDGKRFYAAVRIPRDPEGINAFELWMCREKPGDYRQIIAEADGSIICYQGVVQKAGTGVQVTWNEDRTQVLFSVPAAWLGSPLKGSWRFNICRNRAATLQDEPEYSSWSALDKGFNDIVNFGTITFQ